MKVITSIINGNRVIGSKENKIDKKFLNEQTYISEIEEIKQIPRIEETTKPQLTITKIKDILTFQSKKYEELLAIECSISKEAAKKKLTYAKKFLEKAFKTYEKERKEFENKNIYLRPKGKILISISSTDPLEGFLNAYIPAIYLGNTVITKPSRKSCLLLSELFLDLKKEGIKDECNILIISNEAFTQLIKEKYIDFIYWTGSFNSSKKIEKITRQENIEFYFEGSGKDILYIDESFNNWKLFENIINNNILDLNGTNCNRVQIILVKKQNKEKTIKKLKEQISKITALEDINTKENLQIGPLGNQIVKSGKEKIAKLDATESIQSFSDTEDTLSPIILINPNKKYLLKEEIIGPVISLLEVKNIKEAKQIQKETEHGLGITILTNQNSNISDFISFTVSRININKDPLDVSYLDHWGGIKMSGQGGATTWLEKFSNKLYLKK